MNPRWPYHLLNAVMILGGVGFILAMLNLVKALMQFRIIHFLGLIGVAVALKFLYSLIKPGVKDPITTHPMARRFFYLGMGVLATALAMRSYNIPYYNVLLYLDIPIQLAALGISFSVKPPTDQELNEEILDA